MSSDTPTPREYKDADGKPISLMALVVHEPEWATSQILHRDKLERELAEARKELAEYRAATDPHYVDELAALKAEVDRLVNAILYVLRDDSEIIGRTRDVLNKALAARGRENDGLERTRPRGGAEVRSEPLLGSGSGAEK